MFFGNKIKNKTMRFSVFFVLVCQVFSLNEFVPRKPKVKHCVDCHFFVNEFRTDAKFGRCALFPRTEYEINYLVTGISNKEYHYCSTARGDDAMCGEEGIEYTPRKNP